MMNGLVLGLDIGIASVGAGILKKDTGEIIHANSRLFPAATADNNVVRRGSRQARRLTRRKRHRAIRLHDLFEDYGKNRIILWFLIKQDNSLTQRLEKSFH